MTFDDFITDKIYVKATETIRAHYLYDRGLRIYVTRGYFNYAFYYKDIEYHKFSNLEDAERDLYFLYQFLEDETNE